MAELKKGDIIYRLRHKIAESKIRIDKVNNGVAYSFTYDYKFKSSYEGTKIINLNQSIWTQEPFGISYCIADEDIFESLERELKIRFIRNAPMSKLTNKDVEDLYNTFNSYIEKSKDRN